MKIEKEEEGVQGGKRMKRMVLVGMGIVLMLIAGMFFAQRSVYSRAPGDPVLTFLVSAFPYPAVRVGSMVISMKEYVIEYQALQNSFSTSEKEQPPAPEKLQETILQTLINKRVIAQLAKQYDVKAEPDQVDAYFKQTIGTEQSEEDFEMELTKTFGWTTEEFKKRVIEPIVLAVETNTTILKSETAQADRRTLIDTARDRVTKGEDFSSVAKEIMTPFGLSESDLGFFSVSALPGAWRDSVEALAVGETSEVLQNENVFTFFKVIERNPSESDAQVHLLTVAIPKKTLEDLVKDYLAGVEVKRYLGT